MRALGRMKFTTISIIVLLLAGSPGSAVANQTSSGKAEYVVLLHGLARSPNSMSALARSLESAGYRVCNISYPSRKHSIEKLATEFVAPGIRMCISDTTRPVHFVTHSLGGIIVRQLAASIPDLCIGRVVMLSPPNHGSEIVDKLGKLSLFRMINGPAGLELGTHSRSVPQSLGEPNFQLGVVTGNRSINLLLSRLIPGEDDGKVSLASAKLAAMKDFVVIRSSHPFIMKNKQAIAQSLHFLQDGTFVHPAQQSVAADRREDAAPAER
jgi:triacylglycerol lipase